MRVPLAATLALTLVACTPGETVMVTPVALTDQETALAQAAVANRLRDPMSAQFREIAGYALPDGGRIVCGELNARNGFGGYNGFAPFYVRLRGAEAVRVYSDDGTGYGPARIGCTRAAEGAIAVSG